MVEHPRTVVHDLHPPRASRDVETAEEREHSRFAVRTRARARGVHCAVPVCLRASLVTWVTIGISVVALITATYYGYWALKLQVWTAGEDFRNACLSAKVRLIAGYLYDMLDLRLPTRCVEQESNITSLECEAALLRAPTAPPEPIVRRRYVCRRFAPRSLCNFFDGASGRKARFYTVKGGDPGLRICNSGPAQQAERRGLCSKAYNSAAESVPEGTQEDAIRYIQDNISKSIAAVSTHAPTLDEDMVKEDVHDEL